MATKIRKIYISQLMHGRTEEEILNERKFLIQFAEDILNVDDYEVQFIDSYFGSDSDKDFQNNPLWYLGESLKQLSQADGVIFGPGWTHGRGCLIEKQCCELYGIPIVYAYNN